MKKFLMGIALPLVLVSCSSDDSELKSLVEIPEVNTGIKNESVYAIPSPNEQFDLLHMLGGEMIPGIGHDLSRLDDYTSLAGAALNFGIYTADAAYMMRFEQGKKVFMDYVSALDKLGDRLGIANIYGDELMDAIEEAEDDAMLLYDISGDNYLKVYDKMLENEKEAELCLILAGGWVQTMYILFKSAGEFNNDMEIESAIAEQIYVLDNLIGFMSSFNDKIDVAQVIVSLENIADKYAGMDCESAEVEVKKGQGTFTLTGGDNCLFTEESYNALRGAVLEVRTKFTEWL